MGVFDLLVIVAQVLEFILHSSWHFGVKLPGFEGAPEISLLRFARFIRCIRVVRFAKVLRFVAGLRMLIVSIEESLHSLAWVLFVLALQTFVFGAFVTQAVTAYKIGMSQQGQEKVEDHGLQHYWGTLDRSVLSLYQVLADGIHWSEILEPALLRFGRRWLGHNLCRGVR